MRSDQTIRPAVSGDMHALGELALRSKAYWGYSKEFLEACREELTYSPANLESPRWHFCVVETSDRIAGFYCLEQNANSTVELEALFVEPDCMGTGIGRILIESAKDAAVRLGATALIVQADPNARGFYVSAGGVFTEERESQSIPGRLLPVFTISLLENNVA